MSTQPEKRDLVITHIFDAPVERVWQAWSDPEDVKQWWGPDGFTAPIARALMGKRVGDIVEVKLPKRGNKELEVEKVEFV